MAVVALDGTLRSDGVQGVQKLARITERALGLASLNNGTNLDAFGTWKILSLRIAREWPLLENHHSVAKDYV